MSRLDPRIRWVWMLGWVIPVVVVGLAAAGMILGGVPVGPYVAAGLEVFLVAGMLTSPFLEYRNWSYELRPDELVLRYGVVTKVERWVPRLRIQHVDLIGGPIERLFGLRQLVIYTAGTREADVKIPGLPPSVAEQLRSDLLEWTRAFEAVDAQPGVDVPPEPLEDEPAVGPPASPFPVQGPEGEDRP